MSFVWALALSGLFLIYLEFFFPGGIPAIGGSVLLIGSIFMFYRENPGFLSLTLYLISLSAAIYAIVRIALWRIRSSLNQATGLAYSKEMVGKSAKAATDLTPSGQISINDQLYQALSESGSIDKGRDVTIIGGEGSQLIVTIKSMNP